MGAMDRGARVDEPFVRTNVAGSSAMANTQVICVQGNRTKEQICSNEFSIN